MTSRISGIGLAGIQKKTLEQHSKAFLAHVVTLPVGGFYRYRARSGEAHGHDGRLIHILQTAVQKDAYATYLKYSEGVRKLPPIWLRDLLDFRKAAKPNRARAGGNPLPKSVSASSRPACPWVRCRRKPTARSTSQ